MRLDTKKNEDTIEMRETKPNDVAENEQNKSDTIRKKDGIDRRVFLFFKLSFTFRSRRRKKRTREFRS